MLSKVKKCPNWGLRNFEMAPTHPLGVGQKNKINNVTIKLTDPINRGIGTVRIVLEVQKCPNWDL